MSFYGDMYDITKALIAAVYDRPVIWDQQHPQYRNLQVQDRMLEEIAFGLRTSRVNVEREWNLLLNRFKQECEKYQHHYRYSRGSHFISDWPFFEMMSFLKEHMLQRINEPLEQRMFSSGAAPEVDREFMPPPRQFAGDRDFRRINLPLDRNIESEQFRSDNGRIVRPLNEGFMPHQPMNVEHFIPQRLPFDSRDCTSQPMRKRKPNAKTTGPDSFKQNEDNKPKNSGNVSRTDPNAAKKAKDDTSTKHIARDNVDVGPKNDSVKPQPKVELNKNVGFAKKNKNFHKSNDNDDVDDDHNSEDLIFFRSLLPYMKSFPRVQKLKLRNRIQQIILDELEGRNSLKGKASVSIDSTTNDQSANPDGVSKLGVKSEEGKSNKSATDEKLSETKTSFNNSNPTGKSLESQQSDAVSIPFLS